MHFRPLIENEFGAYDELAAKHGTVFDTLKWLSAVDKNLSVYGCFDKGGRLVAGFHPFTERRYFLRLCRDYPFTPFSGPFWADTGCSRTTALDTHKKILSALADLLDTFPCDIISCALPRAIVDAQPFIWKGFKVIPNYTYLLDLAESEDALMAGMSGERRNDIKKALKDGLTAKRMAPHESSAVRALIQRSFQRQDMRLDAGRVESILSGFADDGNSFSFVTLDGDKPIAAAFCIHDRTTAYYLLGGYDHRSKHHGGSALALWECIKHARQAGLKTFDFEGSMVPAIERFFRGFGGALVPYYRVNKAKLPLELALKFFHRDRF